MTDLVTNSSDSGRMMSSFVEEILNGHDLSLVGRLFAPNYRDHDPLVVPGLVSPVLSHAGTRRDLEKTVELLASEACDLAFHLTRSVGDDHLVAYQLFGEGTLDVNLLTSWPSDLREALTEDSARDPRRRWLDAPGKLVGNRLHVEMSCVGLFRVAATAFVERWGPMMLR